MKQEMLANAIKENKKLFLIILVIALCGIYYYNYCQETAGLETTLSYTGESAINCSLDSGFYNQDIEISLSLSESLPDETVILYTTNGDDPIENGIVYSEKIKIIANEETEILSLQAVACHEGKFSDVIYRTYFVGQNVYDRYTYPIVSISTANTNLFDFEKGIFVDGITYQNYLDNGGDPNLDKTLVGCNYNQRGDEWIRESYLEVFDADGTKISSQGIGLGVSGRSSSGLDFKSLKLVADEMYDENNTKFEGEFWRQYAPISKYRHNYTFNKIILKAGGQEQQETQIRWDLISGLAEEAGLYPIADAKKVIVYVNGEYYGIMTMSEDYSAYNIGKACGLDNTYIEKVDGAEIVDCLDVIGITDLFLADLDKEANREALENVVDVDQFLLYYAIQIITNNVDWPHNNYGMWRYTGEYIEGNEYSDGRYRFYLFDVDLAYMPDTHWRKETYGDEIFDELMNGRSEVFINVMESEYYRAKFINILSNLCNTAFSEENVEESVDKIVSEYKNELMYWESNEYNNGDNWLDSYKEYWEANVENVKNVMLQRNSEIYGVIESYWPELEAYILEVDSVENARIYCNSTYLGSGKFTGNYYRNYSITLSAEVDGGLSVDYWLINGNAVYEETVTITEDMIEADHCTVSLILKEDNSKGLIINEVYAKGDLDWIELYNASDTAVSLENYYLTDNISKLEKYSCPSIVLSSGSVAVINGKYNNELGAYLCNFSLASGETLYLVNKETLEIVDQVTIPKTTDEESYGRYKQGNGWYYFTEPTKGEINN